MPVWGVQSLRQRRAILQLEYPYTQETNGPDYIPIDKRRPSATTRLCLIAVDDVVGLIFDDEHFPSIRTGSEETTKALQALVNGASLPVRMTEAATSGSVGSVALRLRIMAGKPRIEVMNSEYLTPDCDVDDPEIFVSVTEKYCISRERVG